MATNIESTYTIRLASCPNPDFGETKDPKEPVEHTGTVSEIMEHARRYRDGLGSGNWLRADIFWGDVVVAWVSYNLRIWTPDGRELDPVADLGVTVRW